MFDDDNYIEDWSDYGNNDYNDGMDDSSFGDLEDWYDDPFENKMEDWSDDRLGDSDGMLENHDVPEFKHLIYTDWDEEADNSLDVDKNDEDDETIDKTNDDKHPHEEEYNPIYIKEENLRDDELKPEITGTILDLF